MGAQLLKESADGTMEAFRDREAQLSRKYLADCFLGGEKKC